jgi:hypothetical protein
MFDQNLLGMGGLVPASGHMSMGGYVVDSWMPAPKQATQQPQATLPQSSFSGMYKDPFSTAMSGTQSGTLQPYVNRNTQNANRALYGGLLGYQPQSIVAGDAGGTPINSTPPQFNMQNAIPQQGQGLNFTGFGNRSWMGK